MQNYNTSALRNTDAAAGISNKVSVPMPGQAGGATTHDCKPGSKVSAPQGFAGGIISGKV